jgi:uncharacterized ion transporter superfamily protein YfcC
MEPNENLVEQKKTHKTVTILIIVVVAVLAVYFVFNSGSFVKKTAETTEENIVVQKTDLSSGNKLPAGMPDFIPVETSDVKESYSMNYVDRRVILYAVSYTTSKSIAEKFAEYLKFMTDNGYKYGTAQTKQGINGGTLFGINAKGDLSVILSKIEDKTYVQVSYVDKNFTQ